MVCGVYVYFINSLVGWWVLYSPFDYWVDALLLAWSTDFFVTVDLKRLGVHDDLGCSWGLSLQVIGFSFLFNVFPTSSLLLFSFLRIRICITLIIFLPFNLYH